MVISEVVASLDLIMSFKANNIVCPDLLGLLTYMLDKHWICLKAIKKFSRASIAIHILVVSRQTIDVFMIMKKGH
jgi:hypothetical protein